MLLQGNYIFKIDMFILTLCMLYIKYYFGNIFPLTPRDTLIHKLYGRVQGLAALQGMVFRPSAHKQGLKFKDF